MSDIVRRVQAAAERMADEHPLDTLDRTMAEHGWPDDDPMRRWVREAMAIPYPMTRTEAAAEGRWPLEDEPR